MELSLITYENLPIFNNRYVTTILCDNVINLAVKIVIDDTVLNKEI